MGKLTKLQAMAGAASQVGTANVLVLLLAAMFWGCASSAPPMRLALPQARTVEHAQTAFRLVSLRDARKVQNALPFGARQSGQDVEERALGRRRGGTGKTVVDQVLLSDVPIQDVVRSAMSAAIAQTGGSLVDRSEARYASAVPLDVRIDRFWSHLDKGFWAQEVTFEASVWIKTDVPGFEAGRRVNARVSARRPLMTDARWQHVIEHGVDALSANIARELSAGSKVALP